MPPLPPPQVLACYFDLGFTPPLAAMQLHWADLTEQTWLLPRGEGLVGPPPRRFALQVRRQAEDAYALLLVWDSTYRQYFSLRRREVEAYTSRVEAERASQERFDDQGADEARLSAPDVRAHL